MMKKRKNHARVRHGRITEVLLLLLLFCLSALPCFASSGSPTVAFSVAVLGIGEKPTMAPIYTVRLLPVDHAPMPYGAEESYDLVFSEPGTKEFPPVTFDTVGIYRYSIRQVPENRSDITYDTAEYVLTVSVMNADKGDGFFTAIVLTKDGIKQDGVEFVNRFCSGPILDNDDPTSPDTPPDDPPPEQPEDPPVDEPPTDEPDKPSPPKPQTPPVPDTKPTDTLIQTGQSNLPILFLGSAGIVLVILGGFCFIRGRRRKGGRDS